MTSPPNRPDPGRKKSEPFSPTLTSIDSQAPQSPKSNGVTWDTETDHMLSYFLGGPQHAIEIPDFATSTTEHESSEDPNNNSNNSDHQYNDCPPPPTPAMQFYAHSRKASAPTPGALASSSSSSSSLSSMTAALVSGGGVLPPPPQPQAPSFPSPKLSKDSPISPAEAIGNGIENLMLPPPPRGGVAGNAAAASTSPLPQPPTSAAAMAANSTAVRAPAPLAAHPPLAPPPTADQQAQHLAWLRDINAMARANGNFDNKQSQQQQQTTQQQQQAAAAAALFSGGIPAWALQSHHRRPPEKESEEKRALRLQRNRESARKSRRLKKERLATLENKVNKLHNAIAAARLAKIMEVGHGLRIARSQGLTTLNVDANGLIFLVRNSGPNSELCRSVTEFQCTTLKQMLLPRYQSMMQWFALQPEDYFTQGKAEFLQMYAGKTRTPIARLSSKQVGDELSKNGNPLGPSFPKREDEMRPKRTSYSRDAARMWPLFCYELSFSVEQEERFLAAQRRHRKREDIVRSRNETVAACKTAANLRSAVDSLCLRVSQREEATTAGILTPQQAARYQLWVDTHRARCQEKVRGLTQTSTPSLPQGKEASMEYISKRLSEVLQIRNV